MSNASIAESLLNVIARVERGELSLSELDVAVDGAASAFEGLSRKIMDRLRELPAEALQQDVSPLEEEVLGIQHSDQALQELKSLVSHIADVQPSVPRDVPAYAAAPLRPGRA